jgi:hypothetical protein
VRDLLALVDAREVRGKAAHAAQVALGDEGQVGVAAPQVDDPERLPRRRRTQVSLVQRVGDRCVEDPQELLDLAVLPLPAGLHPAFVVAEPERAEHRVVLGQQAPLVAIVVAVDLRLVLTRPAVHDRLALLAHPELVGPGGGVDVPVAERLLEQAVERRPSGVTDGVVGGVRLRVVVRRHLQVASGLEVDVPQLDPSPRRLRAASASGRDGPDQGLVVQDHRAQPGQRAEERFAHRRTTEAMTTIRRSPARATGMTSRRCRGFTGPV